MSGPARFLVAVVDDDPKILDSLGDLLESAGYEVRVHSSGSSLLADGISSIDCLITDVMMPMMDGFELRAQVKQMRPALPVFLISGRRDSAEEEHVERRAESEIFRKPFDGSALLDAIAKALQGQTAEER
jgi:FixJ family two-component response regulator